MKRFGSIVALALTAFAAPAAAQPVGYGQTGLGNAVGTNVEDVRTLHRFSACVAERYPEEARRTLALDFRTRESGRARHELAQQGRGCIRNTAMGMSNVVFAGAVAEALLEREAGPALGERLRGAANVRMEPRAPSEATAFCIARSAPQQVASLMQTEPGSAEETALFETLRPQLATCGAGERRLNTHITRAMLVLGAYQLLSAGSGQPGGAGIQ